MTNKKNSIIKICFTFLIISQLVAVQSASALGEDETTADYKEKIMNTSKALGISVYEDFPVEFAGEDVSKSKGIIYSDYSMFGEMRDIPIPDLPKQVQPAEEEEPKIFTDKVSYWGYAKSLYYMLKAKIEDSGILPWREGVPSFEESSKEVLSMVKKSRFAPRKLGQSSLLRNEGFLKEMESLSGAKFTNGNTTKFLINGPESFGMKDSLIKGAKKSIYIGSYSIHDDMTGFETADMLIAKKEEGVAVKVIVDYKVAGTTGKAIKRLEEAGVEIIRHMDAKRTGDYWHVKMLIVDDKYAIIGGMNYADWYSHKNPDGPKWRDTDVLYTGLSVLETKKIFAGIWNAIVEEKKLPFKNINMNVHHNNSAGGSARVAVMYQNPPSENPAILLSIVKAIYGATERINIENPYYVAVPAITQAVLDARARGVEVNILTNSKKSIDAEAKAMADIIIKGLMPLVSAGVKVYLKKGETLHSKFMTVDGVYCNIGSYNFHPRSERYDTEMNVSIIDPASVKQLDSVFEEDIAKAIKINTLEDLEYEPGWLAKIVEKYFYAELSQKKK
ncbi:MAG: phosphatidylserine/phosphatidylglycerophosphate/cardiolipin synthase family protein [Elusimicrobiota bacterium]|nr:phosphatidylserine/phosphatidylglycerophosphate/cardiolipin synthase family protein [Elusimicrobiota bacterium]